MQEMLTSDEFTDVTLVTDDKKTIKAHRNILSACSPVFKKFYKWRSAILIQLYILEESSI